MNESGKVARLLVDHFKINFKSDLLVIIDDASLPLGRLRLRVKGQDGGHRGLRSVQEALESQSYARLRVGIAPSHSVEIPLEEFVLSPFEREEEEALKDILERGVESCRLWVKGPIERAMDRTNKPLTKL